MGHARIISFNGILIKIFLLVVHLEAWTKEISLIFDNYKGNYKGITLF